VPASDITDCLVIDAMGSAALLPTAQLPPPPRNGKPWLDRALDSGLTALNVTMGVTGVGMGTDDFRSLLHSMHGYFCYFDLEPRLIHVRTTADIERAKREGRLGVIFGCQGTRHEARRRREPAADHGQAWTPHRAAHLQ
jgi:microsomal dipeptidase-like Zn-dependent dipeptidase